VPKHSLYPRRGNFMESNCVRPAFFYLIHSFRKFFTCDPQLLRISSFGMFTQILFVSSYIFEGVVVCTLAKTIMEVNETGNGKKKGAALTWPSLLSVVLLS